MCFFFGLFALSGSQYKVTTLLWRVENIRFVDKVLSGTMWLTLEEISFAPVHCFCDILPHGTLLWCETLYHTTHQYDCLVWDVEVFEEYAFQTLKWLTESIGYSISLKWQKITKTACLSFPFHSASKNSLIIKPMVIAMSHMLMYYHTNIVVHDYYMPARLHEQDWDKGYGQFTWILHINWSIHAYHLNVL